jgi:hypothetical protein
VKEYIFYSLSLGLPEPWCDITDDLPEGTSPTLARGAKGCGVLQFTIARHTGGAHPEFDGEKLKKLLLGFEEARGLEGRRNEALTENRNLVLRADYTMGSDFIRVYYVSDRANVLVATYLCQQDEAELKEELADADTIIESIKF